MACAADTVKKAKEIVLLARNDADTAWEIVGGLVDFNYDSGAPIESTTSSTTTGDHTTSQANGFKTFTMSASGLSDNNTGTEPITGLSIVGAQRLADLHWADGSCGEFQVQDVNTGGTITGDFVIDTFSRSGTRPGLQNFSASFANKGTVTRVGDI